MENVRHLSKVDLKFFLPFLSNDGLKCEEGRVIGRCCGIVSLYTVEENGRKTKGEELKR